MCRGAAREAHIELRLGLQALYTGRRTVSKAQNETVWDEAWVFRKIDIASALLSLKLMAHNKEMGSAR